MIKNVTKIQLYFFSFYCMQKMVIKDGCSLRQLILYLISYAINPVLPSFSLHISLSVHIFTPVTQSDLEDTEGDKSSIFQA